MTPARPKSRRREPLSTRSPAAASRRVDSFCRHDAVASRPTRTSLRSSSLLLRHGCRSGFSCLLWTCKSVFDSSIDTRATWSGTTSTTVVAAATVKMKKATNKKLTVETSLHGKRSETGASTSSSRSTSRSTELFQHTSKTNYKHTTTLSDPAHAPKILYSTERQATGTGFCATRGHTRIPGIPAETITCAGGVIAKARDDHGEKGSNENHMVHVLQNGAQGNKVQEGNADEFAAAYCFGKGEIKIVNPTAAHFSCFLGGAHTTKPEEEGYWDPVNWQDDIPFAQAKSVEAWISNNSISAEQETQGVAGNTTTVFPSSYVEIVADANDETKFVATWWTGEDAGEDLYEDEKEQGDQCCGSAEQAVTRAPSAALQSSSSAAAAAAAFLEIEQKLGENTGHGR
ncbi:unnamed protein product [Amoebophrya sp. A120]|nr:unnamed protein product [Amoebophrya sp. A120]|eukprot:GSA120T00015824001.1